jgi:hypothetical protein
VEGAFAGAGVQPVERTGEVQDVAVAEGDEVVDHERRARVLIDRHGQEGGVGVGLDDEHRHVDGHPAQRRHRRRARSDHAQRVHALGDQVLDRLLRGGAVALVQGDLGDGVVGGARRELDRAHDARRPEGDRALHEHADAPRPLRGQRPRDEVGAVVEFLDGLEHPPTSVGFDVRVIVEHPRDGHVRHARDRRDLSDVGLVRADVHHPHLRRPRLQRCYREQRRPRNDRTQPARAPRRSGMHERAERVGHREDAATSVLTG